MKKIWQVQIGTNFSQHIVQAENYIVAGTEAMKLAGPVPKEDRWVSKVECIGEVEN